MWIHHKISHTSKLRQDCKWVDKKIKQQNDLWQGRGYGRLLGRWGWEKLLNEREDAWDVAEAESWKMTTHSPTGILSGATMGPGIRLACR